MYCRLMIRLSRTAKSILGAMFSCGSSCTGDIKFNATSFF